MKPAALICWVFVLIIFPWVGCKPAAKAWPDHAVELDTHPAVHLGMMHEQVVAALGKPAKTATFVTVNMKDLNGFGPIYGWIADFAAGEKIEIWTYPHPKGTVNIYFYGPTNTVWHTEFIQNGVVF